MLKKLLIVPALAIGVIALVLMVKGKAGPQQNAVEEVATAVRVLAVPRTAVLPRATGYGEVRPGRVWQAVPQVGGRIVELSPKIREGTFIQADAVLVRIDRADYDLEVKVVEARIAALRAQLRESTAREATIRTLLQIESDSLALAEGELERILKLANRGAVPQADVDHEKRTVLTQTLRVQEIENNLTLLEPQRAVLEAQVAQETSNLDRAKLAVERTVIRAPFDCRIGPVDVEQDQVVQPGQALFSADGTDASEVTAWLALRGVRHVLTVGTAEIDVVSGLENVGQELGLSASIRATAHGFAWQGEVVRVRGIDSKTRSLGLDVAVKDPYRAVVPGQKPPLAPGLYVEVEIRGKPRADQVVIPRSAVHDGVVRVVSEGGRLTLRPVEIGFVQSELAVVVEGLEGGETLVLTDVVPAIEGMLLSPVVDEGALQALLADAVGEAAAR